MSSTTGYGSPSSHTDTFMRTDTRMFTLGNTYSYTGTTTQTHTTTTPPASLRCPAQGCPRSLLVSLPTLDFARLSALCSEYPGAHTQPLHIMVPQRASRSLVERQKEAIYCCEYSTASSSLSAGDEEQERDNGSENRIARSVVVRTIPIASFASVSRENAAVHAIWMGRECISDVDNASGVVLMLVGPEPESPLAAESGRNMRMYSLASLISLAKWAIANKGAHPLNLGTSTAQQTALKKHRLTSSIACGLKSLVPTQLSSSSNSSNDPSYPSLLSPQSSLAGSSSVSARPAPPPRCANSDESSWSRLTISRCGAILLYETPAGERAVQFVKEFYTLLQPKTICFFQQSVQDVARSPTDLQQHHQCHQVLRVRIFLRRPDTSTSYGTQLSIFGVVFEKQAGWIHLTDLAVGEIELFEDTSTTSAVAHAHAVRESNQPAAAARFQRRGGVRGRSVWLMPMRCEVPEREIRKRGPRNLPSKSMFIQHEHSKCTCGHPEGYHPEPKAIPTVTATPATSTVATIVAAYQVPSAIMKKPDPQFVASSSRLNDVSASKAAVDETNAGLKKKRKIPDNAPVSDPKRRRSSKEKEKIAMGQLIMIVTKGVKRGTLKQWTTPKDGDIANMEHVGLAANGLRRSWAFNLDWDATEMDVWFRAALPIFFAYMDSNHPLDLVQPFHYRLMIRSNSTLSLSPQLSCDGKEYHRYLGNNGKTDARKIYLLANHHIPASTYENGWQIAPVVENAPESDSYDTMEEESDTNDWELVSDEDETQQIRRKSIARGKAKAKSASPTRSLISITDEDSEDDLPASIIPALYSSSIPSTAVATPDSSVIYNKYRPGPHSCCATRSSNGDSNKHTTSLRTLQQQGVPLHREL
ncbi:hypothetical protein C8R46DRAFT_1291951 [Mycena filopes]|nr:hypothetical protein C8R46DRAFT_1291951 [Mycena filopes]